MKRFENKTVVVTGASRGIGRAIALAFGQEGANVVVTARSRDLLSKVSDDIERTGARAMAVPADLEVEADIGGVVETALAQFGRIDFLINNAAIIHPPVDLVDFDTRLWRQVIDVNLVAVALLTKAVLPNMIENGAGKIINVSSIGGRKGARQRTAYRAAKAGVISLTESIAAEVKRHGIDVNCICPGAVDTEGYHEAFGEEGFRKKGKDDQANLMDPAEIAALVLFLASDASSAVTGTAIDAWGPSNPLFSA